MSLRRFIFRVAVDTSVSRAAAMLLAIFLVAGSTNAFGDARQKRQHRRHSAASSHIVTRGQTLWLIARAYGCPVSALTGANNIARGQIIRPGQKLRIPECGTKSKRTPTKRQRAAALSSRSIHHVVVTGDTLSRIAKQYDTTITSLSRRNRLKSAVIHPGQELVVVPGKGGKGRPIIGQSRGVPHRGRLVGGMQLPRNRHYYRRRPHRAWGTSQLLYHVKRAVAIVSDRYKVHPLAIGDISAKRGGHLSPHKSHQSGRDIDIGFYFKKRPKAYPKSFVIGNKKNLHMAANWLLLKTLANTATQRGGASKIFLDYPLQKLFYKYAQKRGASKRMLERLFQYPRGRGSSHGIIRYEPGHDDHIHVRFKCPAADKRCNKS